jgi:hypothetical protein
VGGLIDDDLTLFGDDAAILSGLFGPHEAIRVDSSSNIRANLVFGASTATASASA